MPIEISEILSLIIIGLSFGLIFLVPIVIWRIIKRRPVLQKSEKIKSPNLFCGGIALFGGLAIVAFLKNMPFYGLTLLLMMLPFVAGLIAYKKGWRG